MCVGEAARRLVLSLLVLCSLCQKLHCQQTQELTLILIEGSQVVSLHVEQTRSINLVPEKNYTINCNGDGGFGGATMVWFRNGSPVAVEPVGSNSLSVHAIKQDGNTWRLVLPQFRVSDTGRYTCRGTNGNVTLVIGASNLTVIASTPILLIPGGFHTVRYALVALALGTPTPTNDNITWYLNGGPIPASLKLDIEVDEIVFPSSIIPGHAGNYTIEATTSSGTARDTFIVIITIQPDTDIIPMNKQVRVSGTALTLTCEDAVGVPSPSFTWTRGSDQLQDDGNRVSIMTSTSGSTTRSILTINRLVPGDRGEYVCMARNERGSSVDRVEVDVQFGPILEAFSTQLRWVVGSTARLQTILRDANPMTGISYRWLHPSGRTIDVTNYSMSSFNGSTLYEVRLPLLSEGDAGVYRCVVQNNISNSTQTFDVFVTVPPTLQHVTDGSTGTRTVLARNGATQVMLVANVVGARPAIMSSRVSWSSGGTPIDDSASTKYITTVKSTGTQVNLTITTLTMDDTGMYTVTVEHEAGTVSLDFRLEVFDPPLPPTSLDATPVTACTADITWVLAQPASTRIAQPSFIIFEAFIMGTINWTQIGRVDLGSGQSSFLARIPSNGLNTTYYLRAFSGNDSIGLGREGREPETFTAYTEEFFPTFAEVSGEASNDSQTLTVRWTLPSQDCFNFSQFRVTCISLEGESVPSSGENTVGRDLGHALVRGLVPDTFYNCSVEGSFVGFPKTTMAYTAMPIFTFPPKPPAPGVVSIVDRKPTASTLTVEFTLPEDDQSISHYRVYVVRLSTNTLPNTDPDRLFGDDSRISTYEAVNKPDPFVGTTETYLAYISAEHDASVFNPRFTIGDGSQTDRKELFPNAGLQPNSIYTFFLRAYPKTRGDSSRARRQSDISSRRQYVVFTSSGYAGISKTEESDPDTGGSSPATAEIAVGVVVSVFLFLVFVTIVVIIVFCIVVKSSNSRSYKPDRFPSVDNSPSMSYDGTPPDFPSIDDTPDLSRKINGGHELKDLGDGPFMAKSPFIPSGPIKVEDFAQHVELFDSNRQLLFQEEYEWISHNSPWKPAEASNHPLNDEKNRYSNITAFDLSRVELTPIDGIECSDYINANYIAGYRSEQEYIATQGPLEQTVEDFWRMVWEQHTATIIMLTNLVELGKVKCAQYWPSNGKLIYGNLKVTLESSVELPDYTIRNLSVENIISGNSRTVLQFDYTRWPDYGTPQLAAPLLNFLRAVNQSNPPEAGPMVVHCSAGVGRSGTVIAIDYCLHRLKAEGIVDVREFVSRMREQRNYMVQTEQQYTFIHYAILESITYGDTSFPLTDFTSLYEKLRAVNPQSKKTLMDEEYSRLGKVKTMVKKSAFQKRLKRKGEPPRHFDSSFRGAVTSMDSSDNYSGHFVDSYFEKRRYIVAVGPQESTTAKFWQVVWDEDCSFVVMLTPQDSPQLYRYWPSEGEQVQHGNVIVQVESESQEHLYAKRQIKLTNAKVDGISHKLIQYQFMGWMVKAFPRVPDFVKFVCDVLDEVAAMNGNKKVLMHDTDSLGPAGIMCALCYCIDRLGAERMVDIFQAVQSIQLQRPGTIKKMKQYAFTYDCVYEYIRTTTS